MAEECQHCTCFINGNHTHCHKCGQEEVVDE